MEFHILCAKIIWQNLKTFQPLEEEYLQLNLSWYCKEKRLGEVYKRPPNFRKIWHDLFEKGAKEGDGLVCAFLGTSQE